MKKIIIPILLCVIMLFCACKPTVEYTVSPNAVKYKYHTFKGTDWGMTKEECMKALGVDEKDVEPLDEKAKWYDSDYYGFSYKKNIYGNSSTVNFIFMSKWENISNLGLVYVEIIYEYGCNNQVIYDEFFKDTKLPKRGKNDPPINYNYLIEKYESESSFEKLEDKELLEKANGFFNKIQNGSERKSMIMYSPFTKVELKSKPNEETRIAFEGFSAAILHSLL